MLRRFLAVAAVLALGFVFLPRLFKSYASQAQVNAPVVELRAPLESVVMAPVVQPTGRFEEQPRQVLRLRARVADQLTALTEQEALLAKRLQRFIAQERDRLQLEMHAREGDLRRAELDLAADTRELQRQMKLVESGFISAAQIDVLRLRNDSAQVNRDIARANLARVRANLKSLGEGGFLSERSGGADVSYTQQKLDEVRLRIEELRAWAVRLKPQEGDMGSVVEVTTPGQGLLMGPAVTEGAFVAPGDTVAQFVLCRQSFIDLNVPVMELGNYRVGEPVQFRVSGEWQFYQGQIAQVFPMHSVTERLALAVQPNSTRDVAGSARVWVSPDPAFAQRITQTSNCMIGQRVHARLPRQEGWLSRWGSFLADVF